ncbi:Peptidase M28 [Cynara cardunculus var. scolymus]|uniref:Peptidase M28 n=1 Tax=Cynara cardunculus var. scolymus TaxID=59895 RepID=A0A118K3D0_CYNCS|nr:Peptidase M28 [Cynara cardunculus var. scolymus]
MSRLTSGDVAGFKLLFSMAIMYGVLSMVAYYVTHLKFITPLSIDAPLDRFSEARAIEHIRVLAHEIDGRQEGRQGLHDAAKYIRTQLEMLKDRAGSNVRIEIEENIVNGSFNMMFLGHSLSLGYRNHTNIVMRVSSLESKDGDPAILLNGHFDSPPGSPGASDCGSCVASILEVARLTIDSGWAPPKPLIFLFNGAEELFMLGSHGFITTHKWRNTIGAFINLEASGTGGLDLVCQSGPGSWPSQVYAQSAVHPMGNSAAQVFTLLYSFKNNFKVSWCLNLCFIISLTMLTYQKGMMKITVFFLALLSINGALVPSDIFAFVPGDTDYRMFATDFGSIPGLDIIFLHGGYFYHTSTDTVERLLPGSIQARGDNLFSLLKAFTNSSKLENAHDRGLNRGSGVGSHDEQPMQGLVFHSIPVAIFLLTPFFLRFSKFGLLCSFAALFDFIKGIFFHVIGVIFAVILPIIFSISRFARPYLAYMMFVPCSLAGMLIPTIYWNFFPLSQAGYLLKSSKEELADQARFWGAFGLYAFISMAYFFAGLSGGFLTLSLAAFMLPAWIFFHLSVKHYGRESLMSAACFLLPSLPCLLHSVYFSGFLAQFLIEKMGMMGSLPLPHGYFIPDVIVAATIGAVTGVCVGPILPVTGHWLARSSIMQFLLHTSVIALALTSQFFPYSTDAPKRVVLQHTVVTSDAWQIDDTSYALSVLDSNALPFLFKHAPEVAKELNVDSDFSFDTANQSSREAWMMKSRSITILSKRLPQSMVPAEFTWNFHWAPEIVKGGPPSYICRLSGVAQENWTFWLETNSSGAIHIDVGVVEQYLMESMKKLKDSFPTWVDVIAFSNCIAYVTVFQD